MYKLCMLFWVCFLAVFLCMVRVLFLKLQYLLCVSACTRMVKQTICIVTNSVVLKSDFHLQVFCELKLFSEKISLSCVTQSNPDTIVLKGLFTGTTQTILKGLFTGTTQLSGRGYFTSTMQAILESSSHVCPCAVYRMLKLQTNLSHADHSINMTFKNKPKNPLSCTIIVACEKDIFAKTLCLVLSCSITGITTCLLKAQFVQEDW